MSLSTVNIEMVKHFMGTIAPTYDLRPKLGRIRAPTLVIVGQYDCVCPPRASRAIARGISGAKLIEIEGAGHDVPFSEQPEQFQNAVKTFLASVSVR